MATKLKSNFQIMMAHENTPSVLIQQNFATEPEAAATVNAMVQSLGIAQFRGLVKFLITKDNVAVVSSLVTFTNDMPHGVWTTNHS
jgi:hypothetical protein